MAADWVREGGDRIYNLLSDDIWSIAQEWRKSATLAKGESKKGKKKGGNNSLGKL